MGFKICIRSVIERPRLESRHNRKCLFIYGKISNSLNMKNNIIFKQHRNSVQTIRRKLSRKVFETRIKNCYFFKYIIYKNIRNNSELNFTNLLNQELLNFKKMRHLLIIKTRSKYRLVSPANDCHDYVYLEQKINKSVKKIATKKNSS